MANDGSWWSIVIIISRKWTIGCETSLFKWKLIFQPYLQEWELKIDEQCSKDFHRLHWLRSYGHVPGKYPASSWKQFIQLYTVLVNCIRRCDSVILWFSSQLISNSLSDSNHQECRMSTVVGQCGLTIPVFAKLLWGLSPHDFPQPWSSQVVNLISSRRGEKKRTSISHQAKTGRPLELRSLIGDLNPSKKY